uniref:Uncharacterized protein n=1 Tax=Timema cristinae TaxID=61476 RepID=A0A7R9CN60_TIMCR|nr:unnamed protein product [Timema cristinae]
MQYVSPPPVSILNEEVKSGRPCSKEIQKFVCCLDERLRLSWFTLFGPLPPSTMKKTLNARQVALVLAAVVVMTSDALVQDGQLDPEFESLLFGERRYFSHVPLLHEVSPTTPTITKLLLHEVSTTTPTTTKLLLHEVSPTTPTTTKLLLHEVSPTTPTTTKLLLHEVSPTTPTITKLLLHEVSPTTPTITKLLLHEVSPTTPTTTRLLLHILTDTERNSNQPRRKRTATLNIIAEETAGSRGEKLYPLSVLTVAKSPLSVSSLRIDVCNPPHGNAQMVALLLRSYTCFPVT